MCVCVVYLTRHSESVLVCVSVYSANESLCVSRAFVICSNGFACNMSVHVCVVYICVCACFCALCVCVFVT